MRFLGLDVGGANLKGANTRGWSISQPFALWRQPHELAAALARLISAAEGTQGVIATMTGELADCFATKSAGVHFITNALVQAVAPLPVYIYLVDGRIVRPEVALAEPRWAAASNWHALASYLARRLKVESGLLVDLGSTTCDVIPLAHGQVAARGATDTERLMAGELVYTGVLRSPVCALVRELPYRDQTCPVAQELFATAYDAYLTLGDICETDQIEHTADGRPATRVAARDRLARSLCLDREEFDDEDARKAAAHIKRAQATIIDRAIRQVAARVALPAQFILAGQGEFLLREVVGELLAPGGDASAANTPAVLLDPAAIEVVSLAKVRSPQLSCVGPAFAVAALAEEECA